LDGGHEVALVTNAGSVEAEYRIGSCDDHLSWLVRERGLRLRDVSGPPPWHVPHSPDYLERLLNQLVGVLGEGRWDVIESGYLVPYGIAGYLASRLTGVPHVVRHGGSDIAKFLNHPAYSTLLRAVLVDAERVITDEHHEAVLSSLGAKTERRPVYEVNESAFVPAERRQHGGPRVYAYIGKINYHWRRKGLDRIIDWYAAQDPSEVSLRLIAQGVGESDFKQWMYEHLGRVLPLEPFVPPWAMPELLRSIDAVFALDVDETVHNTSFLAIEARQMGVEVIEAL